VQRLGDFELHVGESDLDDRAQIAALMDGFRETHKSAISVLFTSGKRAGIHVAVTDDLVSKGVKAGDIANAIAAVAGGKGGGRPHFASAGVGDVGKLGEARVRTADIVRDLVR
jgi:alanyl-tRNA synthetase